MNDIIKFMKQIDTISLTELKDMSEEMYGAIVKSVVDIEKDILVVDAEMHVDEEQYLLANGSRQNFLWGINLHPGKFGTKDFIEFDSMINIRPSLNNMSRGIDDANVKKKIEEIVHKKVINE